MKILKKVFRVLGIALLTIIGAAVLFYCYCYVDISHRKEKVYPIVAEPLSLVSDSAALAHGERLVGTRACKECHGQDMGGRTLIDDPVIGTFTTRNLTHGKGGLPENFTAQDWLLAMKHGLGKDKKPLYLMPSHELSLMTEYDLAALIAYCSSLPKVDREQPEFKIGPLGYVLSEVGLIPLLPAEFTNHDVPFAKPLKAEVSVPYGRYLSTICINCHGPNLKGGESPVPGGKYVADITSTGNPGKWTTDEFVKALHTGITPEGKTLNPEEMPWTITREFSEEELAALHLYLKSI